MGELGRRGVGDGGAQLAAAGAGREQRHHGADALAAGGDQVAGRRLQLLGGVAGGLLELHLQLGQARVEVGDPCQGGLGALGTQPPLRGLVELREDHLLAGHDRRRTSRVVPFFNES